jgi:hypothetical protein
MKHAYLVKDVIHEIGRHACHFDYQTVKALSQTCKSLRKDRVIRESLYNWNAFEIEGKISQWIMDKYEGNLSLKGDMSYTFQSNIEGSIYIGNSNVSLDLREFTLRGSSPTILNVSNVSNFELGNGTVTGDCGGPKIHNFTPFGVDNDHGIYCDEEGAGVRVKNSHHIHFHHMIIRDYHCTCLSSHRDITL